MKAPSALRWARARRVASALGLTDDREDRWLRAIARANPMEAAAIDELSEPTEMPSDQHIPPALLARWPEVLREIRGLERAALKAHLASCSQCRTELELLGFDPDPSRLDDPPDRK